jgi:DNA invertase Pin-like site-specific DNA recombinase
MLVGYMRVSSDSDRQSTALQRDALIAAGIDTRHLFEDKASGARDDRPGLKSCLEFIKAGMTFPRKSGHRVMRFSGLPAPG